jgi:hypothetical protein
MDRMTYFYIGLVPMFVVFMLISYKKLRNDRLLKVSSIITLLFAIPGVLIRTPEAAMLMGAFVQVVSYAFLRYLFKRKYNFEPTYNRMSWYDHEEGRKQNWLDVIVFVVPTMLSFTIPLAIVILKAKAHY